MRQLLKGAGVFAVVLAVCAALLVGVCALIPQSSIQQGCEQAEAYFAQREAFPLLMEGNLGSRADNYADMALLDVIYNVDHTQPVYSVIAAPYYRNEGEPILQDLHLSVVEGAAPNNSYARYWHGSQVLLRPLLTCTSIEGCRAILFGLLLALNGWLAVLLVRRRAVRPLVIYAAALVAVQFWMCLFSLEYIMSFLVMTGACIAVAICRDDEQRMLYICIASGVIVCFVDFLTTETLAFTVPMLLWLMLRKQREPLALKRAVPLVARFGAAWLAAYALTFAVKWALVYAAMGRDALMNVFASATFRMDRPLGEGGIAQSVMNGGLTMMLARNLGLLWPMSTGFTHTGVLWGAAGIVLALAAAFYLLRAKKVDGAFIAALLLTGLVPYARFVVMASHSYDHYFFTYRAQMATLMAVMTVMAYSLKPSDMMGKKAKKQKRNR